jgi:hypothetical protein
MPRLLKICAIALPVVMLTAGSAGAEVKTREKSQVKFEGFLGRIAGMAGGKAAKEGLVTTNAVKGDRKAEMNESFGRIVDLKEEKVYELDVKDKSYKVTTFEELRQRMREAREKAEKEAPKEDKGHQEKPARELDVDFSVKETGQTRSIAGYNTKEVVMTVTVREKGKALEESGGMVMTSNSWMGPAIPAMKELAEFERRYWKAIAPEASGMSAEQMAALMAMYPMLKQAMERLKAEGSKLEGTPLATTTVFEAVKSKDEMSQQAQQTSGGGLTNMLARRMMKKDVRPRATIFTLNTETLEVSTTAAAEDLQIPAGFKEKK